MKNNLEDVNRNTTHYDKEFLEKLESASSSLKKILVKEDKNNEN